MIASMAMQSAQHDLINELHAVIAGQQAEIERLRAALEAVIESDQIGGWHPGDGECAVIAREALKRR